MKQRPELVNATQEELDEILALTKKTLPPKQYQLLEGVLGMVNKSPDGADLLSSAVPPMPPTHAPHVG